MRFKILLLNFMGNLQLFMKSRESKYSKRYLRRHRYIFVGRRQNTESESLIRMKDVALALNQLVQISIR